jgi:putative hydrolase of the HAD superfamily
LDDTLYDELDYCRSGFEAAAQFLSNVADVLSPAEIFNSLWKQFAAGNHTKTFNAALDDLGINYDEQLIRKLIETYRSHKPEIKLPPDCAKILRQLGKKYTLALLTDGFLPAQELKVQALKIEKYFKCIIYTEQLGREYWKPSPAGFEKLMQALNAKPQNTAYIADNEEKDFIAPNKLGFLTIQITRSARVHTSTSSAPYTAARYVIREISELPTLLEKF